VSLPGSGLYGALHFNHQKELQCPSNKWGELIPSFHVVRPDRMRCMRIPRRSRFMDQVRQRTKRGLPLRTKELIAELNP
jgi:hypothetical protein